jgi:hypothetical protein
VAVGAEGLEIRVSVWRYFLPHSRIANVFFASDRLIIEYADGRSTSLYVSAPKQRHELLVARIDEARRARERGGPSAEVPALDRSGRPMAAWREALRAMLSSATAYREQPIDRPTLVRVLMDVDAPAERRIAAAVALAPIGDEAERIRSVARVCAMQPLRVALERAADDTLDERTLDDAVLRERTARRL